MCGLIFAARFDGKPVGGVIRDQYAKQKSRGTRGFGLVSVKDGKLERYERTDVESQVKKLCKGHFDAALFHHRFPTSVENLPETAHPIRVEHRELPNVYYVAHNGHIRNTVDLRTDHLKLGYKYTTEVRTIIETTGTRYDMGTEWNDSESLAIDVARFIAGKQESIRAEGTIAVIALEFTRGGEFVALHYGRGQSPLMHYSGKRMMMLASEGAGTSVPMNTLYRWNGKETTERPAALGGVLYTPPDTYGYRLPVSNPIGQHWSAAASLPKGDKLPSDKVEDGKTVRETLASLQQAIVAAEFEIEQAESRGFTNYASRLRAEKDEMEDRFDALTYASYGLS